jgi:phosphoribosylanthranilate isomerase
VTYVKICGVVSVDDALMAVAAGADAIGVNLVQVSKRRVDLETAGAIRRAVGDTAEVIAVVADQSRETLERIRGESNISWLQLHGAEPPFALEALLPHAYKAVAIGGAEDVVLAQSYAGERLLVDAKVPGELGGTGQTFDWSLVENLARSRRVLLAGGLTPSNVGVAIQQVRPWGVDVASGVEAAPRKKDEARVRAFIAAVRGAAASR